MIRNNKLRFIISSVITLLPILVGAILWRWLPDEVNIHWNFNGEPDGTTSRAFAVFGIPLFLFVINCVCIFFTEKDNEGVGQSLRVMGLIYWLCPTISLFVNGIIYLSALGIELSITNVVLLPLGVLFAIIGNYLPKCKRNRTIGIKVKWTLESDENWNATHRLGGRLWFVGGLIMIVSAFLPFSILGVLLPLVMPAIVIIPIVYSYMYYKKNKKY